MFALRSRLIGTALVALIVSTLGMAQEIVPGATPTAKMTFRNGSSWGMPRSGLICLGVQDSAAGLFAGAPEATETLTVTAPRNSRVRVTRVNLGGRFVFSPDEGTVEKTATVPDAGFVQFLFRNSRTRNSRMEAWTDVQSFEIRVRFPDGTNAPVMRPDGACGFRVVHSTTASRMDAVSVTASAAGVRAPADRVAYTRVSFSLATNPSLGVHAVPVGVSLWQDVAFSAQMTWSAADNILVGGKGTVASDIPGVNRGVLHGTAGGGFIERALTLTYAAGGTSGTVSIPPVWQIRESGVRGMNVNRTTNYYYRAAAFARARITSISVGGDVVVKTTGTPSWRRPEFTPRVPF